MTFALVDMQSLGSHTRRLASGLSELRDESTLGDDYHHSRRVDELSVFSSQVTSGMLNVTCEVRDIEEIMLVERSIV